MKKIAAILPLLLMVVVIQSCSDKLNNVEPSTSISQQKALSSPGAIKAVRAGMYAFFHTGEYTTDYMLFPEALADNLYNRIGIVRLSGVSQNQEMVGLMDDAGNGNGRTGYDISYDIINQANLLIHSIPKDVIPKSLKKQYRGEAYFIRAFVYHHLVRTLGYAPGVTPEHGQGAGWTKGVPIVTQPTLSREDAEYHPRSSVVEVYNLIISDLNKAIKLLDGNSAGTPIYPSKAAAEAELARVYLYAAGDQQDFPKAYKKANTYAHRAIQDAASMGVHVAKPSEVATMFNEKNGLNPAGIWVYNLNLP